jgi:hypothetical protein
MSRINTPALETATGPTAEAAGKLLKTFSAIGALAPHRMGTLIAQNDLMKLSTIVFTFLAMASLGVCAGTAISPLGPVRTVTAEPGVVPPGISLVIRTTDNVSTVKALRGTIYGANVAEDVVDQTGTVLIPKESAVELVVRSVPYLGPGGVGMTELILELRAITVNGVRYPVATNLGRPGAGGLGLDQNAAKLVGGAEAGEVLTNGRSIHVPARTLLAFQIEDPIRLGGFRR